MLVWWLCVLPIMRGMVEKPSRPARQEAPDPPPARVESRFGYYGSASIPLPAPSPRPLPLRGFPIQGTGWLSPFS
jgi:hypothetical protein